MFPVSWIIQSRLADVATIVDENVNGVRVVKSFAAEQQQLRALSGAADRLQWGYIKDADLRARFSPLVQNLPQVGLALVLLFGGYMVIHGGLGIGAILAFNAYLLMLQAPFMMLGMLIMMGQRAAASADRIYEIIDEQPTVDRLHPTPSTWSTSAGDVRFNHVDFAYARRRRAAGAGRLRPAHRPGRDRGPGGPDRIRQVHGGPAAHPLLRREARLGGDRRPRRPGPDPGTASGPTWAWSSTSRSSSPCRSGTTSPTASPSADLDEIVAAAKAAGAHEFITHLAEGYDTVVGERGYTLSGGQRQRIAIARTLLVNPPIMVLDDATSAIDVQVEQTIHAGLRSPDGGPDHPDHRPPALDHLAWPTGWSCSTSTRSWPTAPTPSCSPPRPSTPRCWPRPASSSEERRPRRGRGRRPARTARPSLTAQPLRDLLDSVRGGGRS